MINQISFKANYIQQTVVLKKNQNKLFDKQTVSLTQLNPDDARDMGCIIKLNNEWNNTRSFANDIKDEMIDDSEFYNHAGKKFFALTTQEDNFENLDSKKILGLTEVIGTSGDRIKVKYLQVNPKQTRDKKSAEFKHAGTAIIDFIKEHFPLSDIILDTSKKAKNFYLANGFEQLDKKTMIFRR